MKNLFAFVMVAFFALLPISSTSAQTTAEMVNACTNLNRGTPEWTSGGCEGFMSICRRFPLSEEDYYDTQCDKLLPKYTDSGTGATTGAPVSSSCSPVTDANSATCCIGGANYLRNARACDLFFAGPPLTGGSLGTNPTNTDTSSGIIVPTPQSSSAELSSCSAIRFDSVLDILIWLKCIIAAVIIPLIFMLAFLFFLWGMVKYIRDGGNEKKKEENKKMMIYGIIGLTVMVSVWGIVRIVNSTFGFGNTVPVLQTDYLKK